MRGGGRDDARPEDLAPCIYVALSSNRNEIESTVAMSSVFSVYLDEGSVPQASDVLAFLRDGGLAFEFAETFDFNSDTGWCPCRVQTVECGFEWDVERPTDRPLIVTLGFRSSIADEACAQAVAAAIGSLAGSDVVSPSGEALTAGNAFRAAVASFRSLAKTAAAASKRGRKRKLPPRERLEGWFKALADARVDRFVRMLEGDPRIGIRFETGMLVQAQRWQWRGAGGEGYSTLELPREVPDAAVPILERGIRELIVDLRDNPVRMATVDAALCLHFTFERGELTVYPQGTGYVSDLERLRAGISDPWVVRDTSAAVVPDLDIRDVADL